MISTTDKGLLEMLKSPKETEKDRALSTIYKQAYNMIEKLITSNSGSTQDAEDIFHDGLISFYKQAQNNLQLTCAINTYLYAICRNLWLKRLRKSGRSDQLDEQHNEIVELDRNPEAFLINDECAALVAHKLGQLGGDCQKLITYAYFDHYKADKIAKLMNYASPQVARNKKSNCMKRFRDLVLDTNNSNQSLQQCLQEYLS